jgi:hypothetical protein
MAYSALSHSASNTGRVKISLTRRLPIDVTARFKFVMEGNLPPETSITGLDEVMELPPLGEEVKALVLAIPEDKFQVKQTLKVRVTDLESGSSSLTRAMELLGPDPRLKTNVPLNAKDFIQ